jgi:hypothetical protein
MPWWLIHLALMLGGCVGFVVVACCVMSGRCERDMMYTNIPLCCLKCDNFDFIPCGIWDESPEVPSCDLNINFPTKKQSCKRQKPRESSNA